MSRTRSVHVLIAVAVVAAVVGAGAASTPSKTEAAAIAPPPTGLKEVSYFPAGGGWTLMWTNWRPDRYAADFALIRGLGANTVRVIVQPDTFGFPQPSPLYLDRLAQMVDLAAANGLGVQLTLFDWFGQYADIEGSRQWASAILLPYAGDPRVAVVEVKNEIDPSDPTALAWAHAMIPFLQQLLENRTPVTISVAGFATQVQALAHLVAGLGSSRPDFYSIHMFGGSGNEAYWDIAAAKQIAAPVPIWIGETGYPTTTTSSPYPGLPLTPSAQEAAQGHYLKTLAVAADENGLPPIGIWTLYDFQPGAIPSPTPSSPPAPADEYHFGLYHTTGTPKTAAAVVRQLFASPTPPRTFDNGFEQAVTNAAGRAFPAEWSGGAFPNGQLTVDRTVFHSGHASAELRSTDGLPTRGSLYTTVVDDTPTASSVEASVWVRSQSAGARIGLALVWHLRSGYTKSSATGLAASGSGWTRLRLDAKRPATALWARIYLEVADSPGRVWFDDVRFTPVAAR